MATRNALEDATGGVQAPDTLGQPGIFTVIELSPPPRRQARDFTGIMMTMPVVTAGYGGWSRVARSRRKALTEWVGRDSVSITFDFMIDEYESLKAPYVEQQCRNLDRMAGIDTSENHDVEPPLVSLSSDPGKMIPFGEAWAPNIRWFVESLSWNADKILVNHNGARLRAVGTIVLTQFVEDERLTLTQRTSGGKGTRLKRYRVKKGDTLSKIAARKNVYNDASKWKRIATANHIRDPKKLKVGQWLKIP